MSLLEKLFGSKKKGEVPSPQEAIQRLREVQEMLTKKSEFLEKKVDHELQTAKKAGTKNKRGKYKWAWITQLCQPNTHTASILKFWPLVVVILLGWPG